MTRKRLLLSVGVTAVGLVVMGLAVSACDFFFNYTEITAPIGATGEIGVRVEKTHNNCTLASVDEYRVDGENIQILSSTEWEEVARDVYERWFEVSLSEVGDGFLRVSKDCTKEGYQEAVLPITVVGPAEEGVWRQADEGTYPFDSTLVGEVEMVLGSGTVAEAVLTVDRMAVELPTGSGAFDGDLGETRLFFTRTKAGDVVPLLVVSERFFLRFDHLIAADS